LAETFPAGIVGVAESGIRGADDAARLADAGYHAVLVGETLVRSGDRRASVASLVGARTGRGAQTGRAESVGGEHIPGRSRTTNSS
jgi:indole-3-glycerol phosphate synthase